LFFGLEQDKVCSGGGVEQWHCSCFSPRHCTLLPRSLADRERERERESARERVTHTQHVQKHCVFVVGGVGKTDGRWRVAVAARMAH
jgi:hypothetical protein